MSAAENEQPRLWTLIVACGLENEYERDWLGRVKSKRTKFFLKADVSPELAQLVATAHGHVSAATGSARAALTSGYAHSRLAR